MNEDIAAYYDQRSREYEAVYQNPAEQKDLLTSEAIFRDIFAGRRVLELACGTGYWTQRIAETAESIHATDINASMVRMARERTIAKNVSFETADMFAVKANAKYNGLFCGFIWSHIRLEDLDRFLEKIDSLVEPESPIVFIDCSPVAGSKHDLKNIAKTDEHGNTYQIRTLADGSIHLVLKNFPTDHFLNQKLSTIANNIEITRLHHYWIAKCKMIV